MTEEEIIANWDYSEKIRTYIDTVIERNDNKLDPFNNKYTAITIKDVFHDYMIEIVPNTEIIKPESNYLAWEFASLRVLSDLLLYGKQDDEDEQKLLLKIALLLDLFIVLKNDKIAYQDVVLLLAEKIMRNLSSPMLLQFMDVFQLRIEELQTLSETTKVEFPKNPKMLLKWTTYNYYAKGLIISINFRISRTHLSFDENNDMLRYKLMKFTSDMFPLFSEPLINKSWDINQESPSEAVPIPKDASMVFKCYCRLQKFVKDPARGSKERYFENDLERLADMVFEIEKEQFMNDPTPPSDNSIENYTKTDEFSEGYKETLIKYYDAKQFNPNRDLTAQNFTERLRNDSFVRRSIIFQIILLLNVLLPPSGRLTKEKTPIKQFSLGRSPKQLVMLRQNLQSLVSRIDKSLMYAMVQLREISEPSWIMRKAQDFKFALDIYEAFEISERFMDDLNNKKKMPTRYWSKLGSPEISKHWQITVSLEKMRKLSFEYDLQNLPMQIERLYKESKEANSSSSNLKELNQWKAYRLLRKCQLSKFKQIDQYTGLEGLYDGTLRGKLSKEREIVEREEQLKQEQLEKEREETKKLKAEEMKKAEELERLGLERKRKLEEEKFEENKRAKLQKDAASSADSSKLAVMDY